MSLDQVFALNVFSASLGGLPFPLAGDWRREVVPRYGVLDPEHVVARRSTFVVAPDGHIRYANPAFAAGNQAHYDAVIAALAPAPTD